MRHRGSAMLGVGVVQTRLPAPARPASRFRHVSLFDDAGFALLRRWFAAHGYANADATTLSFSVLQELVARAAASAAHSETFVIAALLFGVSIPCLALFLIVPRKE